MLNFGGEQLVVVGRWHLGEGRVGDAEKVFRQAIGIDPKDGEALAELGAVLGGTGRLEEGMSVLRRAVEAKPEEPAYWHNLGLLAYTSGRGAEARTCFEQALKLNREFAEAWFNLGLAGQAMGAGEQAIGSYREALRIKSDYAEAANNLGVALLQKGELAEAAHWLRAGVELRPDDVEAMNSLHYALWLKGDHDGAISILREAIRVQPGYAAAHSNLGLALELKGKREEAEACLREAVRLKPDFAEGLSNLGSFLYGIGELEGAIDCYRRAIAVRPDYARAHFNLGQALMDAGAFDEGLQARREAVRVNPNDAALQSGVVFSTLYHPKATNEAVLEECRRWEERFGAPLRGFVRTYENGRDPEKRLKVGYVSPNFRWHPVGRFILPLIKEHDRSRVEIFCYSDVGVEDGMTARLRGCADHWRSIVGMPDERVAGLIQEDGIDVLVDLTMHMGGSRLLAFARKPAPVQVTYLAYCSTTGLEAMDYRISDVHMDPEGMDVSWYTEETLRVEKYWCYSAPEGAPEVNALPAEGSGRITFGCMNHFSKVSPGALAVWGKILKQAPASRLILHAGEGSHRDRARRILETAGVEGARCEFVGEVTTQEYFAAYHEIDIALDPFPYAGGTTTCDSLWMGVPVVTLAGTMAVGRQGVSLLSNVRLKDLIARSGEEYVKIAIGLAGELERLRALRSGLRERIRGSPLMDEAAFTRGMEEAYLEMWRRTCRLARYG